MKIQTRIALIFTLICTSFVVVLSLGIYYFAKKNASLEFFTRLQLRAIVVAKSNLDTSHANSSAYEDLRNQHLQRLPEENEIIISTDTVDRLSRNGFYQTVSSSFISTILQSGKASYQQGYWYYTGISYEVQHRQYLIITSARNTYLENFLANLKRILITADIIGILIIFSVGLFFSRQVLSPIRSITRQVNRISATSLHKRLNVKPGKDEITMLGDTFNNLLNRLETAFETQNNFVSNASHELNTPLTAIIGEADYTLTKERTPEQYQHALQVIMQQGEKLQAITQSLIQLAQSGFTGNFSMQTIHVDELLHNAIKNAHDVYQGCEIKTDTSLYPAAAHQTGFPGNQQLLELALSNIIMNGCKYSGSKPVSIAVALSEIHIIFLVKDSGIGIPQRELKHIFDPFFRASNTSGTIGYGIGLPLVQNIIRLHKGIIEIHSEQNIGTEVTVKLPKARTGSS